MNVGHGVNSGNSRMLTFTLADRDRGDAFDVVIKRDEFYDTPVFFLRSGRSRCKHEQGTIARANLNTTWSNTVNFSPTVRMQNLTIINQDIATETEEFSYFLNTRTLKRTIMGGPSLQMASP